MYRRLALAVFLAACSKEEAAPPVTAVEDADAAVDIAEDATAVDAAAAVSPADAATGA